MAERHDIALTVNGRTVQRVGVPETLSLLDFLHDNAELTGTKFGCGIGVCRACTVAVRPRPSAPLVPVIACSTPVVSVNGQAVLTVEGLAENGAPNGLQTAFLDGFAFQCGYCTPGFLMAATILVDRLHRSPVPVAQLDAEIERACGSHLCRCTGYVRYWDSIRAHILATPGLTT